MLIRGVHLFLCSFVLSRHRYVNIGIDSTERSNDDERSMKLGKRGKKDDEKVSRKKRYPSVEYLS